MLLYGLTPRTAHLTIFARVLGYFEDEETHTMAMSGAPLFPPAANEDAYQGRRSVLQQRSTVFASIRVIVMQQHRRGTTRHDRWESHNLNASIRARNLRGGGGRDCGLAALLMGAADGAAFALTWGAGMDGSGQA